MSTADYAPPLDKLLTLGDAHDSMAHWPDYLALGLGPEHIPDLICLALDEELHVADSESLEVWAPIHAWRALGQLRAEAAVEPLTGLLHQIDDDDDDWVGEELPEVYGMIGPAAIPALEAYLADSSHGLWARVAASASLSEIGRRHPASRAECVAALTRQLERYEENDKTINADVIAALIELKSVETAPLMERAFAARRVDNSVSGDWEDVQIELGLRQMRATPKPNYAVDMFGPELAAQFDALTQRLQGGKAPPGAGRVQRRKAQKRDKRKQQEPRGKRHKQRR
jgi:hypothetical protein